MQQNSTERGEEDEGVSRGLHEEEEFMPHKPPRSQKTKIETEKRRNVKNQKRRASVRDREERRGKERERGADKDGGRVTVWGVGGGLTLSLEREACARESVLLCAAETWGDSHRPPPPARPVKNQDGYVGRRREVGREKRSEGQGVKEGKNKML